VPVENLERVEVEVDRVCVAGEVDEPPDLCRWSIGKKVVVSSKRVATVRQRVTSSSRWLAARRA